MDIDGLAWMELRLLGAAVFTKDSQFLHLACSDALIRSSDHTTTQTPITSGFLFSMETTKFIEFLGLNPLQNLWRHSSATLLKKFYGHFYEFFDWWLGLPNGCRGGQYDGQHGQKGNSFDLGSFSWITCSKLYGNGSKKGILIVDCERRLIDNWCWNCHRLCDRRRWIQQHVEFGCHLSGERKGGEFLQARIPLASGT